jgi:hypothetical protein
MILLYENDQRLFRSKPDLLGFIMFNKSSKQKMKFKI